MQNEPCVFVCDEFWKDVKALAKKKVVGFKIDIDINGEEISPSARINLYPHIKATAQFIIQMLKDGGSNCLQKPYNIHRNQLKTLAFYY